MYPWYWGCIPTRHTRHGKLFRCMASYVQCIHTALHRTVVVVLARTIMPMAASISVPPYMCREPSPLRLPVVLHHHNRHPHRLPHRTPRRHRRRHHRNRPRHRGHRVRSVVIATVPIAHVGSSSVHFFGRQPSPCRGHGMAIDRGRIQQTGRTTANSIRVILTAPGGRLHQPHTRLDQHTRGRLQEIYRRRLHQPHTRMNRNQTGTCCEPMINSPFGSSPSQSREVVCGTSGIKTI